MKLNRILVVDDEEPIRKVLDQGLSQFGYRVALAGNGEEALQIFGRQPFDIIITDLKMPKMDGLELMKRIRATDSEVVFLVITGYPSLESAVEALTQGIYDYIIKPFHLGDIRVKIYRIIEKKRLEKSVKIMKKIIWVLFFLVCILSGLYLWK